MASSNILKIADALVLRIQALSRDETNVEVVRTYHRRFDAEKTPGKKVYVIPRQDVQGPPEQGADRGGDVYLHTFMIGVAERIPSDVLGIDEKDVWVDDRVDYVTALRDALDEVRDYDIAEGTTGENPVAGMNLIPAATGARVVYDEDELNERRVFVSSFEHVIREA